MVTLNAHYDGKVIVPDEPLALAPNQRLRVSIQPIDANDTDSSKPRKVDLSKLVGLGYSPGKRAYEPAEEDALWEKGPLPR